MKRVPDKPKSLKYREIEVYNIIESIMSGKRLITLLGLNGIGKSSVAKEAIHFMCVRKYFTGGVVFINLKQVTSFRIFIGKVKRILMKSLDLAYCNTMAYMENPGPESFMEFILDIFNGKKEGWRLQRRKFT